MPSARSSTSSRAGSPGRQPSPEAAARRDTLVLGAGALGLAWALTTTAAYLPPILERYTGSTTLVGLVLAAEGAFALTLPLVIGPWSDTIFSDMDIELSPVILRSSYLLLIGFFLGYLAEQEKQFRAEMLATTDAMEKPRLEIGLGGSVSAIARLFLRVFGASEVAVVITERENGRTLLWRTDGPAEVDRGGGLVAAALDQPDHGHRGHEDERKAGHPPTWVTGLARRSFVQRGQPGQPGRTAPEYGMENTPATCTPVLGLAAWTIFPPPM